MGWAHIRREDYVSACTEIASEKAADGAQQHWSMLVFESLSAGAMALFVAIVAVMALVGAYLIFGLASGVLGPLEFRPGKIRALVR